MNSFSSKSYAVKNKNNDQRKKSSSGGLFSVLATEVLNDSGVVYGVTLNKDLNVSYLRVEDICELEKLNGSKYVQCPLGDTFNNVKKDLQKGIQVLFSGMPCQVDGLRSFLGREYENLLLCDIVCHGCPSKYIFDDFIKSLPVGTTHICFREKEFGWDNQKWSLSIGEKKCIDTKDLIQYRKLFYKHLVQRPSCYRCPYTTPYRNSDITMADYWGIESAVPDFKDDLGVSLALIHNEHGARFFNRILEHIIVCETPLDKCLQPQLKFPIEKNDQREYFWKMYTNMPYKDCVNKFAPLTAKEQVIKCVPYYIRKKIRK